MNEKSVKLRGICLPNIVHVAYIIVAHTTALQGTLIMVYTASSARCWPYTFWLRAHNLVWRACRRSTFSSWLL